MSTLFYPIFTFLLLAICIAYCAMTAVYPSDWSCYREVTQLSWTWRVKKWSLNWPRAVSVTVCFLNSSVLSFLSSSGNAVYKVTAVDDKCTYVDHTCNPKVSAYVTVFCCTAFDSRLESWTKHLNQQLFSITFCFLLSQTFSQTNVTKVCPGSQCMFAFYGGESIYHRYILVLHLCNLFVFLWLVNFTIALGQCTLAGAFASYYWALRKPEDIPLCPLYSSFSRAIRYFISILQKLGMSDDIRRPMLCKNRYCLCSLW